MESVKLGENGQIAIPRAVMKRLALKGNETLLLDVTDDGAIRLRPAAVLPIEMYSDARIREFEDATAVDETTRSALARRLTMPARQRVRIFLDANIIFLVGYSSTSPVHDLLALARRGDCELVTSSYALEEARRNLAVKGPSDVPILAAAIQCRAGVSR